MSQDIKELLPELKRLAEAATPGPWTAQGPDDEEQKYHWSVRCPSRPPFVSHELCRLSSINSNEEEDATFIAAANPAALLAIEAHIEALERQLAKLDESNLSLHRQLAAAQLDAQTAWGRYENANSSRITTEQQLAALRQAERQAPEWISISDKKPAAYRDVLITLSTGAVVVGVRAAGPSWDWAETDNPQDAEESVTHWMYFPAAPSAGQAKPEGDKEGV